MAGPTAADATMTPGSVTLLRESISAHQAPSLHCATPPRSAVINGQDETPLLLLSPPTSTCSKTMPPGGRTIPIAPSSSDPVDPDLGFPPELPDQVDVTCNDDASRRERRLRRRHRPPRPQSGAIFTGSHVFPTSWLAGTERNLATKTYVAVGTPVEIRHLLTGPSTRYRPST